MCVTFVLSSVIIVSFDELNESSQPGVGVAGINECRVLQLQQQPFQALLDFGPGVVVLATDHHLKYI